MGRHTCIICKRKREGKFMENVFSSNWACSMVYHWVGETCNENKDIERMKKIRDLIRELENIKFTVNHIPSHKGELKSWR
jgi:hypothetical protein